MQSMGPMRGGPMMQRGFPMRGVPQARGMVAPFRGMMPPTRGGPFVQGTLPGPNMPPPQMRPPGAPGQFPP